jgi:exosortase
MSSNPSESAIDGAQFSGGETAPRTYWGPLVMSVLVLLWFYGFEMRYGSNRTQSALDWLWSAWNGENDYEHGPLFPLIIVGLVVHRFKSLKAAAGKGSAWGLVVVMVGAMLYAAAYRTLQPRVAIGALPFLLWGSAWYFWGGRVAKILLFPLFFFWLAIPLPSFQQATTQLQLLATSMAHHGAALCGVETLVQGNQISSVHGGWEPLEIAKGCSGIRSLMALLMISGAWACIADLALWKRAVLFLSAFPLAILGNSLRVISIFVIAEYGDAKWARSTWHDWSGLLLFYPISLMLLLCIHSLLEGGLPWKHANQRKLRRVVVTRADESGEPESHLPES